LQTRSSLVPAEYEMENPILEKEKRYAGPVMGFMYAGLIAISTIRGYFLLVDLPWFVTQFAYGAVILLGIIWIFITGDSHRLNTSLNVMLVQMLPQIIIVVWSVLLWVNKQETLESILRGSSLVLYQILLLAMLIFAGAMFGKKAIEYTAIGFILANTLILLDVIRRFGPANTITGLIQFLMSAGSNDNTISRKLEVQDLTFGIGILLVYYIVEGKDEHWRKFYILALGFYFLTGLKRILFPAIAVGILYYLFMKRRTKRIQFNLSVTMGIALIVVGLVYVILIRTDIWFKITDTLGINLMGRKRLYNHVKPYYTISPIYMGLGFGRVSKILEVVETTGNRRLHCDVLRLYIELGMPVSLLWGLITYVITYIYFHKKFSARSARMYFAITLLMFVTFMTDNTIEKYCPQIAWHVLPLALALKDKEEFADSLLMRKKNPDSERRLQWVTK